MPTSISSRAEIHLRRRSRCGSCLSLAPKFCPLGFSSSVKMEPRQPYADGFSRKSCNNWKGRWTTVKEKTNRTRRSNGWFCFLLWWRQRRKLRTQDWIQMCSNLSLELISRYKARESHTQLSQTLDLRWWKDLVVVVPLRRFVRTGWTLINPLLLELSTQRTHRQNPESDTRSLPKFHLPVINTAEANGISTVAHNRSLAAKAMMYRLVDDRSFGFLYTAKQTRTFPTILTTFIVRQILASMITSAKLRFCNSRGKDISALTWYKIQ